MNKNKKIKSYLFAVILLVALLIPQRQPAEAFICWVLPCSGLYTYAIDIAYTALLVKLKEKGIEFANNNMSSAVGGSTPMFVTNWQKFLQADPEKVAVANMDKYLTRGIAQGKSSVNSYIPKELAKDIKITQNNKNYEGVGPNSFIGALFQNNATATDFVGTATASTFDYNAVESLKSNAGNQMALMLKSAKDATINKTDPAINAVDPSQSSSSTVVKDIGTYLTGNNNPFALNLKAEGMFATELQKQKDIAQTKGIAGGGWTGKENAQGDITTTAQTAMHAYDKTVGAGIDMLSGARKIPEAAATIATAAITKKIDEGINGAFASAQKTIDEKTAGVKKAVSSATNKLNDATATANKYIDTTAKTTNKT